MAQPWKVAYSKTALDFIAANVNSKRIAEKLFEYRRLLEEFPNLGRSYDPLYPAARPPFPCRVISVPDTPFDMYYVKDESALEITIILIEFQRVDPMLRFS